MVAAGTIPDVMEVLPPLPPKNRPSRSLAFRFWRILQRIELVPGECWEWPGSRRHQGYGFLRSGKRRGNRDLLAHRVSYTIHHGPIPDGEIICHSCDNRPCVNPDHLFAGTDLDNSDDKIRKGRPWMEDLTPKERRRRARVAEGAKVRALFRATPAVGHWANGPRRAEICAKLSERTRAWRKRQRHQRHAEAPFPI